MALIFSILLSACNQLPALSIFPSDSPTELPTIPTTISPKPGITIRPSPTALTPTALPQTPAPTLDVQASQLKGLAIRLWYSLPETARILGGSDLIQAAATDFQANNPWGIKVEGKVFANQDELYQTLQSSPSTGLPDLLMLYPFQASMLEDAGQGTVDLTTYLNDPQWGLPADQARSFYPAFLNPDQPDGPLAGLPFSLIPEILLYNQTWAEELGFNSAPGTPQEFRSQACAAAGGELGPKAGLTNRPGGWAIDASTPAMLSWLEAYGIDIISPDQKGYAFNTSQVTALFTFLRSLYEGGCAWKPGSPSPVQEFAARKALFISQPLSALPAIEAAMDQAQNKDIWTLLPYPSPAGKPALSASALSWSIIHTLPERQLAAWLLLREMVKPELQAAWASASSSWPATASAEPLLQEYQARHPAWSSSLSLLPATRPEPSLTSWAAVRWALSDAGDRLFSATFHAETIPLLVKMLDETAIEIGGASR